MRDKRRKQKTNIGLEFKVELLHHLESQTKSRTKQKSQYRYSSIHYTAAKEPKPQMLFAILSISVWRSRNAPQSHFSTVDSFAVSENFDDPKRPSSDESFLLLFTDRTTHPFRTGEAKSHSIRNWRERKSLAEWPQQSFVRLKLDLLR